MRAIVISLLLFGFVFAQQRNLSVAFLLYGDPIPQSAFHMYDWLVVDPDSEHSKKVLDRSRRNKLIAYISVGEAEPYREYFNEVKSKWLLGYNHVWQSYVVDLRKKEYFDFLFRRVIPRMERFDGFFLDTLDSYELFLKDERSKRVIKRNLTDFIRELRRRYPHKLILLNRGFDVMEEVRGVADVMVAENLFYGITYDEKKNYKKMTKEETQWLLERLRRAQSLGYTVIVIDYVDPRNRPLQLDVARLIYSYGFIPYVSDRYLRTLGVSTRHIMSK